MNALAKRAGVSRAAFYSHFSGLDELMGAMLQKMLDRAQARGHEYTQQGRSIQDGVRFGFGMLAAYVELHQAFLRGALDWKFSHRTYMVLLDTMTALHAEALRALGDEVPVHARTEAVPRWIVGGCIALVEHWLVATEEQAAEGMALDATELLASLLATAPDWYTGLRPGEPIDAAPLLRACRAAQLDEAA